jgi:hypothetical protein
LRVVVVVVAFLSPSAVSIVLAGESVVVVGVG